MSVKMPKRLSSKKKKLPKDNAQVEVLNKLGLEAFRTKPLDPASMLDISTWNLENQAPLESKDLPNAFLRRLWLLRPDARSTCCQLKHDAPNNGNESPKDTINGCGGENQCDINPLDLVSAVFMSANSFLQQEIAVHMVQCQFAVPLVLPNIDLEEPSHFLLWPLRGVLSHWESPSTEANRKVQQGNLASTFMPMISCVKLGRCGVSKSQVLNYVMGGTGSPTETFLHRDMDGGQLPRRLSNGLIEIGWYLPTGDTARDIFSVPVVISNLRGDASAQEKYLRLLCQASSAVVVLCGNLREKEKQLLSTCKNIANNLILIDLSDTEENDNRVVGFVDQNLGLTEGLVLQGNALNEEELASRLCDTLRDLLPDKLKPVTLEAAAKLAEELGIHVDEGAVCKRAMAKAEEVLKGLEEGATMFRKKQLPLQGLLWKRLAQFQKEEKRLKKNGEKINSHQQKEKKDIFVALSSYKMTPAMKMFTDVLHSADKVERTCFLTWMKLKLSLMQPEKHNSPQDFFSKLQIEKCDDSSEILAELVNGVNDTQEDSDSFCTDSTPEEEIIEEQPVSTELQISGPQLKLNQDSQKSTDETKEPHSQQKAHLESMHEQVIELPLNFMSKRKTEELNDGIESFDEHISDPDFDGQNSHLESGENGGLISQGTQIDESVMTPRDSDSTSARDTSLKSSTLFQPDPSWLGLEHFLREMGLIFELTHISPGSGSHNVLRLPSLATDLLLYGIPLELMDGDASSIPISWLGCVFAELKRRLPQDRCRTRVLTSLGVHHAKNAEVLSSLFGVKFPEARRRSTRGLYMTVLCLPDKFREDLGCDFLMLIDVEGLCLKSLDNEGRRLIHDNEMATIATGLSDVLMQNVSPNASTDFEANLAVIVNALLRTKECGSFPICQLLAQDEGINTALQVSQLKRISDILQTKIGDQGTDHSDPNKAKTKCIVARVKGPWDNVTLTTPVDAQYCKDLLTLKQNLFEALKKCTKSEATGLPEFMSRLCAVWDTVRQQSFSIDLQNTDIASDFSFLCTELSEWEDRFQDHAESWLTDATKKIIAMKARALDPAIQNKLLSELKEEAGEEIKAEVDKLRTKVESHLRKDEHAKLNTFQPILMRNLDDLQERVTEEMKLRLDTATESHCSSTQLQKLETLLESEQDSKLHALLEISKSSKVLFEDSELEEEFESVWTKTVSSFDFRPSESEDITARVTEILKENLSYRGLEKHIKKVDLIGQNPASTFLVYDEHFGYRSRLKHMFEDNNRLQRLAAQKVASDITEEYNQFVAAKSSLTADFSDNYITELLGNVENALKENTMEIRSAFEVDLKVYLCNCACRDFQKLHDRYAKDTELLTCMTANKSRYLGQFIYRFRKRDQCQRMAQAFTSMVIKPTVLDYIYKPLGMHIVEEICGSAPQYRSSNAFHQSLLEGLLREDCSESFLGYLDSYDSFRLKKIQQAVEAYLFESASLNKWRQQRLGEIVGRTAAAVSQSLEGTSGVLSDTKMLLGRVCLTLEKDGDVDVTRAPLDGPLFSITTEWDRFVTCLMELLASMRLELAQEFSQNVDVDQLLKCLTIQPQEYLFNHLKGCEQQCPVCRAPCELTKAGHEVHRAVLHRPKAMVPHNSESPPCISLPGSMAEESEGQSNDTNMCKELHTQYPDWSSTSEDPNTQMASSYWRYVLARFNKGMESIPEDWKMITEEEALCSLREAFLTAQH